MARKPKAAETETAEQEEQVGIDPNEFNVLEFEENLEDIEEPELLPEKTYVGEITEVTPTANQAGTGYYYLQKVVIPVEQYPPDYDPDNAPEGTPMYHRFVSVPRSGDRRAMARVKRWMQVLGLPLDTNRVDINEWVGRPIKVTVRHARNQDGSFRAEIATVAAADA